MAVVRFFAGSVESYQACFTTWVVAVRPDRCPHCGGEGSCISWGSYRRWVYTTTDRLRVRIERVRCRLCGVTDALLPSFLHLFRRYLLRLIQKAITLADAVGPYHAPAPSTIREWLWSFVLSADWLLPWLQHALSLLEPLSTFDPGRPPAHLQAIRHPRRRAAFTRAWQVLRLAEALYAGARRRQPDLAFQAVHLLPFLAAALGAARRVPGGQSAGDDAGQCAGYRRVPRVDGLLSGGSQRRADSVVPASQAGGLSGHSCRKPRRKQALAEGAPGRESQTVTSTDRNGRQAPTALALVSSAQLLGWVGIDQPKPERQGDRVGA